MSMAAGIIFKAPDGKILLLKRAGEEGVDNFVGHWALPGGGAEDGETPELAARREANEEIGKHPEGDLKPINQTTTPNGFIFHTFGQEVSSQFTPTLNDEHTEHVWVDPSELPQPMHPAVSKLLGMDDANLSGFFQNGKKEMAQDCELAFDRALYSKDTKVKLRNRDGLAFDFKSSRTYTPEGHLHVEQSNISKANVSPYRGNEIPKWKQMGLEPMRIYQLLRDPKELEKAASTFNNKPLLSEHVPVTADDHDPELVVGNIGGVKYEHPYLKADLGVWRRDAIDDIEAKEKHQLSSAYRYRADMTPGNYLGAPYDGVMRDIVGNHTALVKDGRAGDDVVVGDSAMKPAREMTIKEIKAEIAAGNTGSKERLQALRTALAEKTQRGEDKELAQDSKRNLKMAKPKKIVLSRTAVALQGALSFYLRSKLAEPSMAMDSKAIDLTSILVKVSGKNFKKQIPSLVKALGKVVPENLLAQDADLEDLKDLLEAFKVDEVAEGTDIDATSGLPSVTDDDSPDDDNMDDVSNDSEPMAKVMQYLKGKVSDEDLAAISKMCEGGAAADAEETAEEKTAREAKEKEAAVAKDKDEPKVTKKEMEGAMDAALKKNTRDTEDRVVKRMQGIADAKVEVAPLVGELVMAFDSAAAVRAHALGIAGVEDVEKIDPSAYPAMVIQAIALKNTRSQSLRRGGAAPELAMDEKAAKGFESRFPRANKIELG